MANLILVRHGQSLWNKLGIWTGVTDIGLSDKGKEEAKLAGEKLKAFPIDFAYTSVLLRAKQTLAEIKTVLNLPNLPTIENAALNERHYGIFTGKNKWEIKSQVGENEFLRIRRSWDAPIEKGESLKDVYNRVIPYYQTEILPKLKEGKNVLLTVHGNSLRALTKYLENISDKEIENLEIATGEINVYKIENNGAVVSKSQL